MTPRAKVKVTVTSTTKQAYNSVMSRDDQKMTLRAEVKVTMTFGNCISVSNAMYNMIQVSDIGPLWPLVLICLQYGLLFKE